MAPLELRQTAIALDNMLKTPENWMDHIKGCTSLSAGQLVADSSCRFRFAAGTMLKVAYGHDVASVDDPLVKIGKCDEAPSVVYALTSARSRSCLYFDGADWRHVSHLEFSRIFPVYEVHLRS